jgi:peptidoglycan/xylan/chitin deacetylase (PgdA/CDA1 family)
MSRRRLARVLDEAQILRAMLALRARFGAPWITVLTYHRVAESPWSSGGSLFDDGVVDTSPDELDEQLRFVRRRFDPITLDDLIAFRHGGRLPKNPVLVTFDDGYRDNHDIALPILVRHGIQGVFFIATSYVEERRLFWWDRINYVLKSCAKPRITLEYPGPVSLSLDSEVGRSRAILDVLRIVKHSFGLDLDRFLEHLGERAGVTLDREEERRFADQLLMSWDQIRHLQRSGMAVQSHTVTHRVVQTLDAAPLAVELVESKAKLEAELGARVRALAYPVGITLRFAAPGRGAVVVACFEL